MIDEGVMTIDGNVLYQKRMVRDGELSEKRALAANRSVVIRSKNEEFAITNAAAKRPAKAEQNTEYENEIEYESEDEEIKKVWITKEVEPFQLSLSILTSSAFIFSFSFSFTICHYI